ncbi:hypothetical protein [Gordonia shandongensis]|uniref:hypothetical protein n=1 Tax=Gordonia shandongensis TaxID=376351 RepID=UPI0004172928|nr:hypothetical protein [Gordonia shandongensis]
MTDPSEPTDASEPTGRDEPEHDSPAADDTAADATPADDTATDDTATDDTAADDTGTDDAETADTETADTETRDAETRDAETADTGNRSPHRRWAGRALAAGGVLTIAASAGLSGFFWFEHRESRQIADERPAVLTATKEGTAAILSYRADTAPRDVAAAQKRLTGAFADEYRTLARTEVLPAAKDRGLSSTVNISGVSVVEAEKESAQAMVFVTQQVSSERDDDPTTTATAIRVGLVKHDDRWLIESFQPL